MVLSLPVQGAWIEICFVMSFPFLRRSLPVQGAWIEMSDQSRFSSHASSLPVQGAWIEMSLSLRPMYRVAVAPRAGRVD